MSASEEELPWDALFESEGEVPWDAVREFASALRRKPDLLDELEEVYDEEWSAAQSHETYADLYVPAIIALAASDGGQVKQKTARKWGRFLLDKLLQAGEYEDDFGMDTLQAACGNLAPVVLPQVLALIDQISPDHGAWFHLWGVTHLAVESDDERIRKEVIEKCKQALRRAERGDLEPVDVMQSAWALA